MLLREREGLKFHNDLLIACAHLDEGSLAFASCRSMEISGL